MAMISEKPKEGTKQAKPGSMGKQRCADCMRGDQGGKREGLVRWKRGENAIEGEANEKSGPLGVPAKQP